MSEGMPTFQCGRCGSGFLHKSSLKTHLLKANACVPLSSEHDVDREELLRQMTKTPSSVQGRSECRFCHRKFNHRSSMYRHLTTCNAKWYDASQYDRMKAEILNELQKHGTLGIGGVSNVETASTSSSSGTVGTVGTTTNINITTNINNTVNIINAFGRENLYPLVNDAEFMDMILKRREKGVVDFVKAAYFDKNHPENMNVKVSNYKLPYVDTFDGKRWIKCDKTEVLQDLLSNSCDHIDGHYEDCRDQLIHKFRSDIVELIEEFISRVKDQDNHTKFFDDIKRRIHLMMINESDRRGQ